jgi:hypothetical protein
VTRRTDHETNGGEAVHQPQISIIVPAYGRPRLTDVAVLSLRIHEGTLAEGGDAG